MSIFTAHCLDRMIERNVTKADVMAAMKTKELVTAGSEHGRTVVYSRVGDEVLVVVWGTRAGRKPQITSTYWAEAPKRRFFFSRVK